MLTLKTRYAMMASLKLAREVGNGPILISEIAKSEKIPQRYLESILLELKNNGVVGSKIGKTGGYFLMKAPEKINLLDIVRLFEGGIAMMPCISEISYQPCEFCKDEDKCKVKKVFKEIRDNTYNKLKGTTLNDLL